MDSLTEKVLHFKNTGEGQTELFSQIRILIYFFPRKCGGWNAEDSSDFFCFFQDRISRIIARFTYQGKSFSSYLSSCIRFQMICFQRQAIKAREHRECLCREEEVAAEEITYNYSKKPLNFELIQGKTPKNSPLGNLACTQTRKKILLLCLKSCYYLDSQTIDHIAAIIEMPGQNLHYLVQELKKDLDAATPRIETLRQKRMELFLMLHFYQKRRSEEASPDKFPQWNRLCDHYRRRLSKVQNTIYKTRVEPRHEDIARVLGLPKGTVDSSLFTLKKKMSHLLKKP